MKKKTYFLDQHFTEEALQQLKNNAEEAEHLTGALERLVPHEPYLAAVKGEDFQENQDSLWLVEDNQSLIDGHLQVDISSVCSSAVASPVIKDHSVVLTASTPFPNLLPRPINIVDPLPRKSLFEAESEKWFSAEICLIPE